MMVDHLDKISKDMFKVQIRGNRILSMDKNLPLSESDALGIGPVYLNSDNSKKVKKHLDSLIISGEKNMWCYSVFDSLLDQISLNSIFINGEFWCEVDTLEDYEILLNFLENNNISI